MNLIKEFEVDLTTKTKRVREVLEKLDSLSDPDKITLGLYAENQSYQKVADILGVSKTAVIKRIKKIRLCLSV